ncbi:WD40 repeat-containing protein [Heterostelium album PN500]|uniref:WD40 repeat-containing protein n=1 Tax=Heterostelium pallidum (strain ATCC 26659 / Pp 5 / PN500) TaxID=670386 RepID=D3B0J9_HETP5|nr:WD40 repeat-containing protein [Heterostelium album PN500]EFA84823.1 WD40 repeat-containing protein [Heterostelium album PN500]|eukprot:XP_020436934.1 WD40 repeat-containing protein [Heterostelium album PN500]
MSNNDKKRIFFGGIQSSNLKKDKKDDNQQQTSTFLPFSKITKDSQQKHQQTLDEHEKKKRSKLIVLPTNDNLIKLKLRELGEPIILFGEKPEDRRARLKQLCIERNILDAIPESEKAKKQAEQEQQVDEQEAFLTEGTEELKHARMQMALFSLKSTQQRLERARQAKQLDDPIIAENLQQLDPNLIKQTPTEVLLEQTESNFKQFSLNQSEIGDERQLSSAIFTDDDRFIVTGGWSGLAKLWSCEDFTLKQTFTGHKERVVGVASTIQKQQSDESNQVLVATASADMTAMLWSSLSPSPLAKLEGHTDSVNRVAFHPDSRHLATTSSDRTWRLWDVETAQCLLDQEGHSESLMGLAFQKDGALVATGGKDCLVRVWDLRSGRPLHYFKGHTKQVISIDWSPNGYQFASASEDNSVMVWDLRKKERAFHILAHTSIVSCVRYQKSGVGCLATASFDGLIKLWSPHQWKPITILEGHSSKVTCVDISNDNTKIVSSSFDKTWKLWSK